MFAGRRLVAGGAFSGGRQLRPCGNRLAFGGPVVVPLFSNLSCETFDVCTLWYSFAAQTLVASKAGRKKGQKLAAKRLCDQSLLEHHPKHNLADVFPGSSTCMNVVI